MLSPRDSLKTLTKEDSIRGFVSSSLLFFIAAFTIVVVIYLFQLFYRSGSFKFQTIQRTVILPNKHDDKTREFKKKEEKLIAVTQAISEYQKQEKALSDEFKSFVDEETTIRSQVSKLQNDIDTLNDLIKKKEEDNNKIIEEAKDVFMKQLSLLLIKRVIQSHLS